MESPLRCWLRRQCHSLHRPLAPAVTDVIPPISATLYFSLSHDKYKLKTTTNSTSKRNQHLQFLSSFSPLSCSKYSGRFHADTDTGGFRTTARSQSQSQSQSRSSLPKDEDNNDGGGGGGGGEEEEEEQPPRNRMLDGGAIGGNSGIVVSSVVVGLLTGVAVVLFNNSVYEIRDLFWDGIPYRGASWLRDEPLDSIWIRVVSVPTCGGIIVALLNAVRFVLDDDDDGGNENAASSGKDNDQKKRKKRAALLLGPLLKAVAACFTLGTGNSLGPEGPSVEIGASIAKGLAASFNPSHNHSNSNSQTTLSLLASGSAAGISSGFNAAVAGCFFAVESVLWPYPSDSSVSLTNTTSMVILSSVIASVVSEVGLGSEPAFKIPEYDFRSPGELPLYLLLGILCGLVSLTLSRCTSSMLLFVNNLQKAVGMPKAVYPVFGGLAVGTIALAYPEILYWGFENVDILLESRPFVKGLSADLLIQLIGVKVVATALCRASGLIGGYYAPSLFIGAATGMAYGKLITFALSQYNPTLHFPILEVASPQAYGLVGMAATLAGVCQVPLTAVLLLFELTQDYRIVIPLLGAVGLSSWVTSGQMRGRDVKVISKGDERNGVQTQQPKSPSGFQLTENEPYAIDVCEIESSLCVGESSVESFALKKRVLVSEAMRTRYVTVLMSTLLTEAVSLMLVEKQSCAMIIDDNNILIGLLTLRDIEDFCKPAQAEIGVAGELLVSQMCPLNGDKCRVPWTAIPSMDLLSVQIIMDRQGVAQVPVVSEHVQGNRGLPVGLLDGECVSLTFRALATREFLGYIP